MASFPTVFSLFLFFVLSLITWPFTFDICAPVVKQIKYLVSDMDAHNHNDNDYAHPCH